MFLKTSKHFGLYLVIVVVCGLSTLSYILLSCKYYACGFPLDDAWIHQTYARNLIRYQTWSFVPGVPSSGTTAPLWTALISIGYWFDINNLIWAFFLGWIFFVSISIIVVLCIKTSNQDRSYLAIWGGLLIASEWHLIWASASGMETLVSALINIVVVTQLIKRYKNWLLLGILVGVGCWARPDSILLLLPVLISIRFIEQVNRIRLRSIFYFVFGFFIIVIPYVVFNQIYGGNWLPNTFFAKQVEYEELRKIPFINRFFMQVLQLFIGIGILLLPGFIYKVPKYLKNKDWINLSIVIWCIFYIMIYSWRLPVVYQHGRYLIPIMPVYFTLSLLGIYDIINSLWRSRKFILYWSWILSMVFTQIAFWILGVNAYIKDVTFIESNMVNVAKWIERFTESDAIIATHDIGAIGFFCSRKIVDLAGLVTPEVIPFVRDEKILQRYLNKNAVNYLVAFPGWYPYLTKDRIPIYIAGEDMNLNTGSSNMVVYSWSGTQP